METLFLEVLSNVGWAAALALVATLADPVLRQRPALIHGLWVLVLLKLVTPSLVHLTANGNSTPAKKEHAAPQLPVESSSAGPALELPADKVSMPARVPATLPVQGQYEERPDRANVRSWPWLTTAVVGWLAGVAAWWSAVCLQMYRFRRLLQAARPAPEALGARTSRLAARLDLRKGPSVWLVPASVPPMIWAPIGSPRLLLPEELWDRLDERQQETVLIHELAHLRRRDHWVRRLEAVVLGLYWWNPVAWWARRQVEQAEEQCCDSWVLWTLPGAAEAYAEALVATAVFLSGPRMPWPVGATGVGRVRPLRRRLEMILHDPAVDLGVRSAPRAALLLGVVSLVILPAWATGRPPRSGQPPVVAPASTSSSPVDGQETKTKGIASGPEQQTNTEQPGPAPAPTAERKVQVSQPIVREVSDYENFAGRVDAAQSIELRARVGGTLVKVHYQAEQTVEKGSPLFEIDPRSYRLELEKAEAEVMRSEVQLKKRSAQYETTKRLRANKNVSQQEVDLYEADRDESQASLRAAQATSDLAKLKLEFTTITAPIRGRLSRPRLGEGSLVAADTTVLATIETSDPMYVNFDVPEKTVLRLARARGLGASKAALMSGRAVQVRLADENGYPHSGRIDSEDIRLDVNTGTLRCRAVVSNPDGILLPGLFAQVRLITSAPFKAMLVSDEVVVTDQGEEYLYVVNDRSVIELRRVKFGENYDGLRAVKEGLNVNEWVVTARQNRVYKGMKIEPEKVAMPDGSATPGNPR